MQIFRRGALALLVAAAVPPIGSCALAQDLTKQRTGHNLPYAPDAVPRNEYGLSEAMEARALAQRATENKRFLAIYSGSTSGSYYHVASALCRIMEMTVDRHGIRCTPLRSQGVRSNVALMQDGRAQMIIVQSDTNLFAADNSAPIAGGRSVMSLHDEMGVLVATDSSGIDKPADLRGKRVNIGEAGGAARKLWEAFLGAQNMSVSELGDVIAAPQSFNRDGICDGRIDAFGLWIGHPAPIIDYVLENCGTHLVSMWNDDMQRLIDAKPYYYRQILPAGTYKKQTADLAAFGIKASLVAYEPLDPEISYWLVRSVVENIDLLKSLHPALANLSVDRMFTEGNFLPFHDGAARYWKERGMLKGDRVSDQ
jgi:TRAP transporter TAXI family solute receptor